MFSCFRYLSRGVVGAGVALIALALPTWANANKATVEYDFAYRLSGDRRVAPIQVFDDGASTWLQYQPGQTLPAVFAEDATVDGGLKLAPYTRQGPYLVLDGAVRAIVMRIGNASARADYIGNAPRPGLRHTQPVAPQQWGNGAVDASAVGLAGLTGVVDARVARHEAATAPYQPSVGGSSEFVPTNNKNALSKNVGITNRATAEPTLRRASAGSKPQAASAVFPVATSVVPQAPALEFDAALSDGNMRRVLQRWARQAGWRFDAEHWTVKVDIPLTGAASFGADFRNAVRGLLAATELADHPLQPCFYSNHVLRVIPVSQACDRTVSPLAPVTPLS